MEPIDKSPKPRPTPNHCGASPAPVKRAPTATAQRGKTFAEGEADLAPPAELTQGTAARPRGSTFALIQAANVRAAARMQGTPSIAPILDDVRATEGLCATGVSDRMAALRRERRPTVHGELSRERDVTDAEATYAQCRGAETAAAVATPMGVAAEGIGRLADMRFAAAMEVLMSAGLARKSEVGARFAMDEAAVGDEAAFVGGALAADVDAPRLPSSMAQSAAIGPVMKKLKGAAHGLTSAALAQRFVIASTQAKDLAAQQAAADKTSIIEDIVTFASQVIDTAGSASAGGVVGLATTAAHTISALLGGRDAAELQARIDDLQAEGKVAQEASAWEGLQAGIANLEGARDEVMSEMQRFDESTQELTAKLAASGSRDDAKAQAEKSLAPGHEQAGAMGQHLGKLLEAQRFTATARDAFDAAIPSLAEARTSAGSCLSVPHEDAGLLALQEEMRAPANVLSELVRLAENVSIVYGRRLAELVPSVAIAVKELAKLSEHAVTVDQ